VLQEVIRELGTIKYTTKVGGLRGRRSARKMVKLQYKKSCAGSCAMDGGVMQNNRKVTIEVTVHDLIARRHVRGVA